MIIQRACINLNRSLVVTDASARTPLDPAKNVEQSLLFRHLIVPWYEHHQQFINTLIEQPLQLSGNCVFITDHHQMVEQFITVCTVFTKRIAGISKHALVKRCSGIHSKLLAGAGANGLAVCLQ
jgi:hypothetical protein